MAYSNEDGDLTVVPARGPNRAKTFQFLAFKGLEIDPGTKRKVIAGRRQAGLFIATSSAEGKFTLEGTSAEEYIRWWQFLHGKGQTPRRNAVTKVSYVLTRPGVDSHGWKLLGCQWPAPGIKAGDNGVEPGKIEVPVLDIHLDGASIYEQ